MIEVLTETLKYTQRGSPAHILTLKKLYECELKLNRPKDAEIILRNIIELMATKISIYSSRELISSKFDLLLHKLNYSLIEANF